MRSFLLTCGSCCIHPELLMVGKIGRKDGITEEGKVAER